MKTLSLVLTDNILSIAEKRKLTRLFDARKVLDYTHCDTASLSWDVTLYASFQQALSLWGRKVAAV